MPPPGTIVAGIVLKVLAADGATKVYVNVCGHDSVGLPLTKSMDPIPDASFMDFHGLDNLIIPISVGDPKHHTRADDGKAIIIDVVVHTQVIKRASPTNERFEKFLPNVTALALDWVTQETGIQLTKKTVKLLPSITYKDAPTRSNDGSNQLDENIRKRAAAFYEQMLKSAPSEAKPTTSSGAQLPEKLNVSAQADVSTAPRRMVVEMSTANEPVIRKGFLNNPKARLYDDKGTTEGVLPEGAGDPLGYLPKSLRDRVKVVDTREGAKPSKAQSPFTIGNPDAVTGAEFLDQLSMIDKATSNRDPREIEQLAERLQQELSASNRSSEPSLTPADSGWTHTINEDASETPARFVVRLSAPSTIVGMKDVDLAADETFIDVNDYRVKFPRKIDVDSVRAKFIRSSHVLSITCTEQQ